jgi:hypothetical protein
MGEWKTAQIVIHEKMDDELRCREVSRGLCPHKKWGYPKRCFFFKGKAMISHGILMDLMPNCWTSPSDFV